jgi:phosphoesterase RecJ-like protein
MQRVMEEIRRHRRFAVATHVRPDGDAVGAVLAMTRLLRKLGKEAFPFCHDDAPYGHEILTGIEEIRSEGADPERFDAAVTVDCGDFHRVGDQLAESIREIPFLINIDHHLGDEPFGDVYWVDETMSSVCEMLYDLALAFGVEIDAELAAQLYVGVLTDTGSFRYSNTNHKVLETAAGLVAAGAEPARIAEHVYESASPKRLLMQARMLSTVTFYKDNRLAAASLTRTMFEEVGASVEHCDGFANDLRAVGPVRMAMLFREEPDGRIHVSLRSKGGTDVAAFAQRHGGGGHRNAAAFRKSGSLDEVYPALIREAADYLS